MLLFQTTDSRFINLSHINGNDFTIDSTPIASLSIKDHSFPATSDILAYRPDFSAHHGTRMAGIFVNMEQVFPCLSHVTSIGPICKMYTAEEDGFNNGLTVIEAGDTGNDLKIFSGSNWSTYGFGFKTCRVLNRYCLPSNYQSTIVCQLPRAYCSSSG